MQQDYDFQNHVIPATNFIGYIIQTADDLFVHQIPATRPDGQYHMMPQCNGLLYLDGSIPDEPIPEPIPGDNLVGFLRPIDIVGGVNIDRYIHFDGMVQVAPDNCCGVLYSNDSGRLEVRYKHKYRVAYYGDKAWEAEHERAAKATA